MRVVVLLALVGAVSAHLNASQRIVGGSLTNINQYPQLASLLYSVGTTGHRQTCAGVIMNYRSILTVAHCIFGDVPTRWRIRLGSSNANSGGTVYTPNRLYAHAQFNRFTLDNDIAMIRTSSNIAFSNVIQAARVAGPNYYIADNQVVWSAGWGFQGNVPGAGAVPSESLRHVQIWSVSQIICRQRWGQLYRNVTDNMLCAGAIGVNGLGQCHGDEGGPLLHNGVVIGLYSFTAPGSCADGRFPSINVRVSRYTSWISSNA